MECADCYECVRSPFSNRQQSPSNHDNFLDWFFSGIFETPKTLETEGRARRGVRTQVRKLKRRQEHKKHALDFTIKCPTSGRYSLVHLHMVTWILRNRTMTWSFVSVAHPMHQSLISNLSIERPRQRVKVR